MFTLGKYSSFSPPSVVSFQWRLFQILPESRLFPHPLDKVTVRVRLDSSVDLYFHEKNSGYGN
jgi:hypothetical protein